MRKDIPNIDLHIHTKLSLCTHGDSETPTPISYEDYLDNSMDFYGFSDHFHYLTRWDNFINAIEGNRQFFKEHGNCFLGVEADFVRSSEDISIHKSYRKRFDYIIASIHNISDTNIGQMSRGPKQLIQLKHMGKEKIISNYISDMIDSIGCKGVKIIGHPFVILGFISIMDQISDDDILAVVGACKNNKVAIEISNSMIKVAKESSGLERMKKLVELSLDNSLKLSLGSDAHKIEEEFICDEINSFLDEFDVKKSDIFIPKKSFF